LLRKLGLIVHVVADEQVSQEEMFQLVGMPITQTCLEGFNGTIICYGQTGSGKSYTTFGTTDGSPDGQGLVPRVLDYLWRTIGDDSKATRYTCKCSFYEIYQERVFDLLDLSSTGSLDVREDVKKGVFVEGITEELVSSAEDVARVLESGNKNRHIGETAMNRESSRSHAVFTLIIDAHDDQADGLHCHRQSRFSMVDLAGSERQRDTSASGERLKEAGVINKSLSALGNVIKSLAERSKVVDGLVKTQHIHYRDSKLTFLLRDSIGGNSKVELEILYLCINTYI
jgi:kinesin family protein 15